MVLRESHAARRLARLFKIERDGGFDRWPIATAQRLIERRGALMKELLIMDGMRRSLVAPRSAELDRALAELAGVVNRALSLARTRVDQIEKDLCVRRGESLPTGIRDSGGNGHLLGKT